MGLNPFFAILGQTAYFPASRFLYGWTGDNKAYLGDRCKDERESKQGPGANTVDTTAMVAALLCCHPCRYYKPRWLHVVHTDVLENHFRVPREGRGPRLVALGTEKG